MFDKAENGADYGIQSSAVEAPDVGDYGFGRKSDDQGADGNFGRDNSRLYGE